MAGVVFEDANDNIERTGREPNAPRLDGLLPTEPEQRVEWQSKLHYQVHRLAAPLNTTTQQQQQPPMDGYYYNNIPPPASGYTYVLQPIAQQTPPPSIQQESSYANGDEEEPVQDFDA